MLKVIKKNQKKNLFKRNNIRMERNILKTNRKNSDNNLRNILIDLKS